MGDLRVMSSVWRFWAALVLLASGSGTVESGEDWPQFRGPGSGGVSHAQRALPGQPARDQQLQWQVTLPTGHSSPVIAGERIFLTGVDGEDLVMLSLERASGKLLWRQKVPWETKEKFHTTGSLAQSTPVTDGEVVIGFFGSSGLHAWTVAGEPLWSVRMGPFANDFGAGSSPVIEGERVVMVQDHDVDSFIAVYDRRSGRQIWRQDRSEFLRNYATPLIWNVNGRRQIVVLATLRIVSYDLETGAEVWSVSGVSRIINMTPVIGDDNILYAACFSPGNDAEDRVTPLTIDELFAADGDGNGTIEEAEFPDHPFRGRFSQLDRNKDQHLTKAEYEVASRPHVAGRNVVLAIRPGGTGDITGTHVLWEHQKQIPYCPSPLFYRGRLYMVKNGGILTVLKAETGEVLKQKRLKMTNDYYASPVAGDGKVYLVNVNGGLTVLDAESFDELHTAELGGDVHATPAISDGRLFVRVGDQLYCFGD